MLKFTHPIVKSSRFEPEKIEIGQSFVLFIRKDTNIAVSPHEDAPKSCCRVAVEGLASGYAVIGTMDQIIKQIKQFRGE